MLLGDSHIEEAIRVLRLEGQQARRPRHGGRDGDNVVVAVGSRQHGPGEGVGVGRGRARPFGHRRLDLEVVEALDLVLLRRAVAAALLRENVHDDGPVPLGRVSQSLLHAGDVMPVDGTGVADAESLEEAVWGDDLAHGDGEAVDAGVGEATESRDATQEVADALTGVDVLGVQAQMRQSRRKLRHRRCVRPAVVVQNDDDTAAGVAQVVERLVGHAAGESTVTEDGHDPSFVLTTEMEAGGDAVGVAEGRRRMAVLHPVVLGLLARRVARQTTRLLQRGEVTTSPGDQLVDVSLVARVPQDDVAGGIEDPVQGQGELDDPEVRSQVPAGGGDGFDNERADLGRQLVELRVRQTAQVGGALDVVEEHGHWWSRGPRNGRSLVVTLPRTGRRGSAPGRRRPPRPGPRAGTDRCSDRPCRPPSPPRPGRPPIRHSRWP